MSPRDRKLAILRILGRGTEPISMSDLLSQLNEQLSPRSVRRWLNQLIEEGVVEKRGAKRSTKYLAVRSNRDGAASVSSCFSSDSLSAIRAVQRPIFERMPVGYNFEWFDAYIPGETFYLPLVAQDELARVGQRASAHDPAGTYAHQIYNRLLIDLSYNSSRLEGNTYSLLDTERLLLHGSRAEGKLDEEGVMLLNHKEAIRYLVENAARLEVNQNTLCTLNYLLADGLVEPRYAGKVRNYGVRIGGSTYMPLEEAKQLEKQLLRIAQKAAAIRNPFEQSFFLLVHISYLQAFVDVNKRTARLAANIPLVQNNVVPLAFRDVEVVDYMLAMISIYELQNCTPLVDLYVYSYLRTCVAYDATVKALGFDEIRVRYRAQRREVVRSVVLQRLVGEPLQAFVESEAGRLITDLSDQEPFQEDVLEDLEYLDESRIAGLGISREEVATWLRAQHIEATSCW